MFLPIAYYTQPESTCLRPREPRQPKLPLLPLQPRKALYPPLCHPRPFLPCLQHTASSPPLFKFASRLVCPVPPLTPLYLLHIIIVTLKAGTSCEISLICSRALGTEQPRSKYLLIRRLPDRPVPRSTSWQRLAGVEGSRGPQLEVWVDF